MRIQEIHVSASCAKMTDEKNMNGDLSSGLKKEFVSESTNGPSSPNLTPGDSECSSSIGGGRLKFFKDGKFILELSHRKEGDRGGCWVPVPKKTTLFWPAVGTPRHESSTSLSVSDDNSSVQSSPWQRDHCWKQSSPRHNAGRGLEFYMVRPTKLRRLRFSYAIRRKRRRPLDARSIDVTNDCREANNGSKDKSNKDKSSLAKVLRSLWERVNRAADPGIVSPRKRILREMESTLLRSESPSRQQRSLVAPGRTVESGKLAAIVNATVPSSNGEKDIIVTLEDQAKRQRARPVSEPVKPPSHSITSILAREDEPSFLRTLLRSPPPPPTTHHHIPTFPLHPAIYPPPPPHHPSSSSSASSFLHHPSSHHSYLSPVPSPWYPLSSLPRASSVYPGSLLPPYGQITTAPWSHLPHHSPASLKRDDGTSDVPLNLSKHAG